MQSDETRNSTYDLVTDRIDWGREKLIKYSFYTISGIRYLLRVYIYSEVCESSLINLPKDLFRRIALKLKKL